MVLLCIILFAVAVSAKCYEATTAYPLPRFDPKNALLKHAFASIDATMVAAAAGTEFDSTSFSVEVTSSKKSLWSYHHTARERNASRPDIPEVNSDALYRIASITKAFTVLGILYLHEAGSLTLDDPVDKYIKELREEQKGTLPWKDITLRSLASQLSGIPREFAQGDMINGDQFGEIQPPDLGLPPMPRDGLIQCDEYSPNYETPCTEHDLLKAVKSQRPIFAPNMKSTYSNVAFELLGLVIERVTNQTYKAYITEAIFKPLSMSKSTLTTPPDSAGVIPLGPNYWDVDAGIQSPTGAIYSSTADLSRLLRYTLSHYNAIATGVNWLNIGSAATGLNSFYGMPWEIFQTDRILKNSRRPVRFVTKSGGLPGYTSIIAMLPEYDLGISILVGGNSDLFSRIRDAVTIPLVRVAESIAIRQVNDRYAGTYTSTNNTLNSSVTLVVDERGLIVERFISNGTDVLQKGTKGAAQIVPTLLYLNEKDQKGELWRMKTIDERPDNGGAIWDDFCISDYDQPLYAHVAVNELVFWDETHGKYDTLELSAFRVNLTRAEVKEDSWWQDLQEVSEL